MIASVSSDIGAFLARRFVANKDNVCATYRDYAHVPEDLRNAGIRLFQCDVDSDLDVKTLKDELRNQGFRWDLLISAVGVLSPIGRFVDLDFTKWEKSVTTNSISQLRLLHGLYEQRMTGRMANVVFFAGGGTNGPFDNFSAYCIGKIALIKMCELIDSECPDLHVSILGTGWVRTKIHAQTLAAGENSGENLERTRKFLNSDYPGTSLSDIAECIEWCVASPKSATSGRNFSVVHDKWREGRELLTALESSRDKFKLRRSGND
jgi:NAD(P)-dependent dehydrogenase (short-subunit alcohol dehydrogenase family)